MFKDSPSVACLFAVITFVILYRFKKELGNDSGIFQRFINSINVLKSINLTFASPSVL